MTILLFTSGTTVFFLMIRRPPRSTQSRSSAASDVYKRQDLRQRVCNRFFASATVQPEPGVLESKQQHLEHSDREGAVKLEPLRQVTDTITEISRVVDVLTENGNLAGICRHESQDGAQEHSLAGSI